MSTVTVVKKNGYVAIAAETLLSQGTMKVSAIYNSAPSKIIRWGQSLFGMAGWLATQQAVDHAFRTAQGQPRLANSEEIFEVFRVIHARLKAEYSLIPYAAPGEPFESSHLHVLIANPYGIFGVGPMRTVIEYERFWAIGSGAEFALGAMHALYEAATEPAAVAKAGLHAAIAFDSASGAPVESHVIPMTRACEVAELESMMQS